MNKKQPFGFFHISLSQCLHLCFTVMIAAAGLLGYAIWLEIQKDAALTHVNATQMFAEKLRRRPDDLADALRNYVVSGDQTYLQKYLHVIDIGDGKQPTPAPTFSIIDQIKQTGISQSELHKLTTAKIESDKLAKQEFEAIKMLRSTAGDRFVRDQTVKRLFDATYVARKAEVSALLDEVMQQSLQRSQTAAQNTQRIKLIQQILIGLSCLLLFLIWLCGKLFRTLLGAAPETVLQTIRELGNGQFETQPNYSAVPRHSLMSHLLHTQAQLKQLETEHDKNQHSLYLISKVFSEAQEGIFLMDTEGTILNVNSAFQRITGYSRNDTIGHRSKILESDQHDAVFFQNFWRQVKQEGRWRGEYWCRNKTGGLFASILNFNVIQDDDGRMLCYLGMLTDITELKTHQHRIEELAFHDPLTQLPNRPLLADRMRQALARVDRDKDLLAVACLDLDGFKAVNDQFGHGTGDALLIEVAHRLLSCVRTCDTVARLGGDEFAILLTEISSREQCETTLQRVLSALVAPYLLENEQINQISGSIGYTLFPFDNADSDTLLRHADHAMYTAKQAGKNRFQYFDSRQDIRMKANWLALARLEKAFQRKEFCLYVQPKINLKSGKVVGAEALIRWLHPVRGLMPPAEFLPLIEDNDLSISVGEWVIREALQLMQQWQTQGLLLPLSININAHQLRQENFSARLAAIVGQFPPIAAGQLEIEIVESAALGDLQKVSTLIAECKEFGINFALDDFGTGYSALTYLKRLAVSTLKIDRSFVRDLLINESDLAIVRGVIGLAKAFKTNIVAEGVESWRQAACLLDMGCEIAQGYAIAHPMPTGEVVDWTRQFRLPELLKEHNNEPILRPTHLH